MFYIEGNIGCGKTTLVEKFEEWTKNNSPGDKILKEPVDNWLNTKDSTGKSILEYYYDDQKRYAFPFQMNAFISRVEDINNIKKTTRGNIFIERSVYTDKKVFTELNYEIENISEIEYIIYNNWFNVLSTKFNLKPRGVIYLKSSPETCFERIKKRNRTGESSIPLDYLQKIHDKHEVWLNNEDIPVLIINADENYIDNKKRMNEIFEQIMSFAFDINIKVLNESNK